MRRVVWYSCGAASAVAAKLIIDRYGSEEVDVVHCNTMRNEHPDNERFTVDVEKWIGKRVSVIESTKFSTVEDVFSSRRYMSGRKGAPCTVELKKKPRFAYQHPDDIHIFGFTVDEKKRALRFAEDNHELNLEWPLIDAGVPKSRCLEMIAEAGIDIPAMYRLGYSNNNCLGCVKATSPHYWNAIRRDFPEVFERRAVQSRGIGCRLARLKGKRIFLDELPASATEVVEEDLSCGPQCGVSEPSIEDWV